MRPALQPYAARPATLCGPPCNPMRPALQPYVARPATLCGPPCNPMWPKPLRSATSSRDRLPLTLTPTPTLTPTLTVTPTPTLTLTLTLTLAMSPARPRRRRWRWSCARWPSSGGDMYLPEPSVDLRSICPVSRHISSASRASPPWAQADYRIPAPRARPGQGPHAPPAATGRGGHCRLRPAGVRLLHLCTRAARRQI